MGLVLPVLVTSAALHDRDGARLLLQRRRGFDQKLRLIWVDGAYRGLLQAIAFALTCSATICELNFATRRSLLFIQLSESPKKQ